VLPAAAGLASAVPDATLLRLFLTDGTSVVSYGEFARIEDRVIFSMPAGGAPSEPRLQAVTLLPFWSTGREPSSMPRQRAISSTPRRAATKTSSV
jgi:hypothetical protein